MLEACSAGCDFTSLYEAVLVLGCGCSFEHRLGVWKASLLVEAYAPGKMTSPATQNKLFCL